MTPDQVEDAGWSPEDWTSFNELAISTVERHAQLRRVVPEGPSAPNAYLVEWPMVGEDAGLNAFSFDVPETRKVSRVKVSFVIKAEQLHDQANIRALIQRVATHLAHWEDRVLAYGARARGSGPVRVEADRALGVLTLHEAGQDQVEGVIEAIKRGALTVRRNGYAPPLHAAIGCDAYLTLVQQKKGSDRARELLGKSEAPIASVPPSVGGVPKDCDRRLAVFAADSGAIDLVWTQRPHIAFVGSQDGNLTLRLEEAFLLRVKDTRAIAVVDVSGADAAQTDEGGP